MSDIQSFDYIIVGAGSAGCVLASRLTEDAGVSVLLLEAGGRDNSIFIHMPAALAKPLANDKYNWFYHSEPEPHVDNRSEEHTSELQSLMRISYAVFCLKKTKTRTAKNRQL